MAKLGQLKMWWDNFLSILAPNICLVCGRTLVAGETGLCLHCLAELPKTNFHTDSFNPMHQRISVPPEIHNAAAWFYYIRSNPYTRLIHHAKYEHRPDIARHLARLYAQELATTPFFDGIDFILPVPMRYFKKLNRGYNQAEIIASGISEITGIPVDNSVLYARRGHKTQTRFGAVKRMENIRGVYGARNLHIIQNRHVLIVDDVFTTGATLHECASAITAIEPSATISVLTLASTRLI